MGSYKGGTGWSVFDTVKFLPSTPDALMAEINASIAALEYTQVTVRLGSSLTRGTNGSVRGSVSVYDADIAEEAYQLGCAALSEDRLGPHPKKPSHKKMAIFCLEHLSNSAKSCRLFASILKDPFSSCCNCNQSNLSCSAPEEEEETPITDFNDMQEILVSMIRSRAMEAKVRRKGSALNENYSFVLHPKSGVLFVSKAKQQANADHSAQQQENSKVNEEMDDFASVNSHFSPFIPTAADDSEVYFSVKTDFSCCSTLKDQDLAESRWWVSETLDSSEVKRRAIIQEVCHCEGWPFGLCRRALLLPPLPKSPSESWSWCKSFPKLMKTS